MPARQPSIRWGRYWIFSILRLLMRTRPAWSAAAKLAIDRLSSDQMPSYARSQPTSRPDLYEFILVNGGLLRPERWYALSCFHQRRCFPSTADSRGRDLHPSLI